MTKEQKITIALGIVPDGARLIVPNYDHQSSRFTQEAYGAKELLYRKGSWNAVKDGKRDYSVDVAHHYKQHRISRHWLYGEPDKNLVVIVTEEHFRDGAKIG